MANNYLRRLERVEERGAFRFPWQEVCDRCAAEGRATTPDEDCEAGRCNASALARLAPDQLQRMREEFRYSCAACGKDPDEEEAAIARDIEAKRQDWAAKKSAMLGGQI